MWELKMKHAIKIFMPVQTWWWSHGAPVHRTVWLIRVFCFCISGGVIQKGVSVNSQAISSWSLLFRGCVNPAEKCQEHYCKQGEALLWEEGQRDRGETKHRLRRTNKAQVALSGSIFHPHISRAWHLLAGMESEFRWKLKTNDLMLTFSLPMWISFRYVSDLLTWQYIGKEERLSGRDGIDVC